MRVLVPQRRQSANAAADLMNALFLGADSGDLGEAEDAYDREEEESNYDYDEEEEEDHDYEEEDMDYYDDGFGRGEDADFAPSDFRFDDRDDFVDHDDDDEGLRRLHGADLRAEGGGFYPHHDGEDDQAGSLVGVLRSTLTTIIPPSSNVDQAGSLVGVLQSTLTTVIPPSSNVKEAKEGEDCCYVCRSNVPNAKFTPCGHSSICTVCADRLICSSASRCPLCRAAVTDYDIVSPPPPAAAEIRDAWDD